MQYLADELFQSAFNERLFKLSRQDSPPFYVAQARDHSRHTPQSTSSSPAYLDFRRTVVPTSSSARSMPSRPEKHPELAEELQDAAALRSVSRQLGVLMVSYCMCACTDWFGAADCDDPVQDPQRTATGGAPAHRRRSEGWRSGRCSPILCKHPAVTGRRGALLPMLCKHPAVRGWRGALCKLSACCTAAGSLVQWHPFHQSGAPAFLCDARASWQCVKRWPACGLWVASWRFAGAPFGGLTSGCSRPTFNGSPLTSLPYPTSIYYIRPRTLPNNCSGACFLQTLLTEVARVRQHGFSAREVPLLSPLPMRSGSCSANHVSLENYSG